MTQRTMSRNGWYWTVKIVVGVLIVIWCLVPLYWGLVVSLSSLADIHSDPISLFRKHVTLSNFQSLLAGTSGGAVSFYGALLSSVIEAVGATVITLLVALPAAYAFARVKFRGATFFLSLITVMIAVPIFLVLIPLFELVVSANQLNTYQAVILILTSSSLPLAIWILRSHIATLPADLEAAARLDGAGTFRILTRIIGPLVAPGMVAAAVVVFLACWGAFMIPLVFANVPATQPITVLVPTFATKFSENIGLQAAAGLLALIPPVLVVVFLQRRLLSGLLLGSSR